MKLGIYSIKDLKTGFLPPTVEFNDDAAIRNFDHACQNTESLFFTHPSDYQFWKLGMYDNETGIIETNPVFLVDAKVYKKEGL